MISQIFGKLTVKELTVNRKHKQKVYLCQCECGSFVEVMSANLKKGNSKSCGCSRAKTSATRMALLNLKHGETKTKLWKTWSGIVERTTCSTSSHYKRYGGAGIGIYKDWLIYENFAQYIGQPPSITHSIDRIDNNKGYEPNNIRWATAKEQAHNRKTNVYVKINGKKVVSSEAAKILNVSKSTISRWVKQNKLQKIEQ